MSFPVESVTVKTYEEISRDPYNAPIKEPKETEVENVLVAPGARHDLDAERPEGTEILYTLYFPKTFTTLLEGAGVKVRGEWLRVVGHPDYFDPTFCPTYWNQVVEVAATHG